MALSIRSILHMRKIKHITGFIACIVLLLLLSCQDSKTDTSFGRVELELDGLLYIGENHQYETWLITDAEELSLGTFTISQTGAISNRIYGDDAEKIRSASGIKITIEPIADSDPEPSDIVILAGEFVNKGAKLTIDNAQIFDGDYSDVQGNYILNTPTDDDSTNELSGIWFILDTGFVTEPGLLLPELKPGWQYQGWISSGDRLFRTGSFRNPSIADDMAPYSQTIHPAPPFPGEDFLVNPPDTFSFPIDLSGETAWIGVEPIDLGLDEPFPLIPLRADISENAVPGRQYSMNNNVENFPKGLASRSDFN